MRRSATPGLPCLVVLVILAGLPVLYLSRCLFTPRVFLPADVLLLMDPWRAYARDEFPDFRRPHNPLLDPIQQYYPWRTYAAQSVHDGEIPLWNPYMFSGTPFVANFQSAIFYPPNGLYYLLPVLTAFQWSAAVALWIAELGMYLFLGTLGLSRLSRLLGAVGFAFSGFMVAWLPYLGPVNVWAWLPWTLFFLERAITGRSRVWYAGLTLALAVQFLAGHAQFSLYLLMVFMTYAVFRLWQIKRGGGAIGAGTETRPYRTTGGCGSGPPCPAVSVPPVSLVIGHWSFVIILAVGMAALQLVPSLELARLNYRTGTVSYHDLLPIEPRQVTHLLFPKALGSPADGDDLNQALGLTNFVESCSYVGMGVFFLACVGLGLSTSRVRLYFAGAALIALLLAFGSSLNWVTFHLVPGMKQLPNVGRAVSIYAFSAAVLAALGLEALRGVPDRATIRRAAFSMSIAGMVCLALFAWAYVRADALRPAILAFPDGALLAGKILGSLWFGMGAAALAVGLIAGMTLRRLSWAVGGAVVLSLVVADLFLFGFSYYPASDPRILHLDMAAIRFLRSDPHPQRMISLGPPDSRGNEHFLRRMAPNVPMAYGLKDIRGSESMYSRRYDRVLRKLDFRPPYEALSDGRRHLIDLLNTHYVMTEMDLRAPDLARVHEGDVNIYENEDVTDWAFLVPEVSQVRNQDEALNEVCEPGFDPRATVLVETDRRAVPAASGESASRLVCRLGRNANRVVGPFTPSWVVLSQAFFPGWKAFCDGRETAIYPADGAVIAAQVPGGQRLDFIYFPGSFVVGLFITLASAALWAGLAVWWRITNDG